MTGLFVSHSSADLALTETMVSWLRSEGFEALFIDVHPTDGIPAGSNWEQALYSELRKADGVVFIATPAACESKWCFAELALARSIGKPVFPVLMAGSARLDLLRDSQWTDLTDVTESPDATDLTRPAARDGLDRLREGMRRAGIDAEHSFSWDPTRSPYPGLGAFGPEDAAVFFGRAREVAELRDRLQIRWQRARGELVVVVGPSGSGKSSLVNAGLLPQLIRLKEQWLVMPRLVPGLRPTTQLAGSLARAGRGLGLDASPAELLRRLDAGPEALVDIALELCAAGREPPPERALIFLDQAEELITITPAAERERFLRIISGSLSPGSPVWVVATLRSEFLSPFLADAGIAELLDDTMTLGSLTRESLFEVIDRPARRAGLDFETGLLQRMVDETVGGDGLPLLAYTLSRLYERTRIEEHGTGSIGVADYEAVGGVVGAIRRQADAALRSLGSSHPDELTLGTLLRLVTVDVGGEPVRNRVRWDALRPDQQEVMQAFIDARLLRSIQLQVGESQVAVVEVAHEALFRQWEPLRNEIARSRRELEARSEIERTARAWDQENRDESYLPRGVRLTAVAEEHGDSFVQDLGTLEREFITASKAFAAREVEETRRNNSRLRRLLAGVAVMLVVALVAGVVAVQQAREAREQSAAAISRRLMTEATTVRGTQPDVSLLLSTEALNRAPAALVEEARLSLLEGLNRTFHVATALTGHQNVISAVAFSPDGRTVASAGFDGTVRLWDVPTRRARARLVVGPAGAVWSVAYSPDGRLIAVACDDGTIQLTDAATGRPQGSPLTGHAGRVNAVAFSPNGRLLASAGLDKTARIWDLTTRKEREKLSGHDGMVNAVAFSPDGKTLASGSSDRTLRRWDVRTGKAVGAPVEQADWVNAVVYSPDGGLLASASEDGSIRLWDGRTGRSAGEPLLGHRGGVRTLAFNRDGTMLASGAGDFTTRLWSVPDRAMIGEPLTGHTGYVLGVSFSPDGTLLASAGDDRVVRLWEVAARSPRGQPLAASGAGVRAVAFSPDGTLIASAGDDRTVRLWESASRRLRASFTHGLPVRALAFNRAGTVLASAGDGGTVRLWDVATGRPRGQPLPGQPGSVLAVAFSPDGTVLATAGQDRTVRLWDVSSGAVLLHELKGHTENVHSLAFAPDGSVLASGGEDNRIRLWRVPSGRPLAGPPPLHTGWILALAFSPDGLRLASGAYDNTVRLWDLKTLGPRGRPLTGHTGAVDALAFTKDGTVLASAGTDGTIRLWDGATGRSRGNPLSSQQGGAFTGIAFDPRRPVLAAGTGDSVELWDLDPAQLRAQACGIANRNLSRAEWDSFIGSEIDYTRTCPAYPGGPDDR